MSKAYCKVHGGTALTPKDLADLPVYVFGELDTVLAEQEKADSERTVEVADEKPGNVESAAQ